MTDDIDSERELEAAREDSPFHWVLHYVKTTDGVEKPDILGQSPFGPRITLRAVQELEHVGLIEKDRKDGKYRYFLAGADSQGYPL